MKPNNNKYTLTELAEYLKCMSSGNSELAIYSVSSSKSPKDNTVCYINDLKHFEYATNPNTIYIVNQDEDYLNYTFKQLLICEQPVKAFRLVCELLRKERNTYPNTIHASAVIKDNVTIGNNVYIAANVVIGNNSIIGDNVAILENSVISDNVTIGNNSKIDTLVSIHHGVIIGEHVLIGSGCVIGNEGFGYSFEGGTWQHIPQMGSVLIGNRVEIGANTCIDRGAIENTVIGEGVIIDNLVHIAHNVVIGENTAIAGCVGIAGSTTVGKNCLIGGKSSISGHIIIADAVQINGNATVLKSITQAGVYASSIHAIDSRKWNKTVSYLKRIEKLFNREANKNE